jgi:DNA-3-methyladenine glycosylase II
MRDDPNSSVLTEETYKKGVAELVEKAPDLAGVVAKWGNPPFWTHPPGFPGIVVAILAQQVSLESAHAAFVKLEKTLGLIDPKGFCPLQTKG